MSGAFVPPCIRQFVLSTICTFDNYIIRIFSTQFPFKNSFIFNFFFECIELVFFFFQSYKLFISDTIEPGDNIAIILLSKNLSNLMIFKPKIILCHGITCLRHTTAEQLPKYHVSLTGFRHLGLHVVFIHGPKMRTLNLSVVV